MALTSQEVRKVAELARLQVTEKERRGLLGDLNQILGYVEQLKEVDLEGVPETFHPVHQQRPLREERVGPSLTQEEALLNAPDSSEGYFRVPRAIG